VADGVGDRISRVRCALLDWLDTLVIRRAALATPHAGPQTVEEYDATCVIPPGARASLDPFGNILIEL
jgi:N-methylhydantoinase A